jgi:hypothetical protein
MSKKATHLIKRVKPRNEYNNLDISVQKMLDLKKRDYDYGIEPEILDNRTQFQKLQDKDFRDETIRTNVLTLFNNDGEMANVFLDMMDDDNINYNDFISVYDDLLKRFKGKVIHPTVVYNELSKLIDNFQSRGYLNSFDKEKFDEIKDLINNQFNMGNLSQSQGNEMMDKIVAFEDVLYRNSVSSEEVLDFLKSEYFKKMKKNKIKEAPIGEYVSDLVQVLLSDEENKFYKLQIALNNIKANSFITFNKYLETKSEGV